MGIVECVHGYPADALGTVIGGVHAGHHCHQGCGRAYIGCGSLSLDVLLAGLESQAEGRFAETVHRYADDTSGDISLVLVAGGHPACSRTAEAHAESESLGCADSYVSSPCGRLFHDCQCE